MSKWIAVKVKEVVEETPDSKTIELEIPEEELHRFEFKPGQFIGLRLKLEGEEEERSYSLSAPQIEEGLKITVKKIKGGKVSTHIVEDLEKGDMLHCTPPEGRFTIAPKPDARRKHYFIAAGSGITPVYSMIRYLLDAEPKSDIYLLYGNRTREEAIFLKKLEELEEDYKGQLHIKYVYSKEDKPRWNIFSIDDSKPWHGRINEKRVKKWLKKHPAEGKESHYYICGPGSMNQNLYQYLQESDIPNHSIHIESFLTPAELKASGTLESTWTLHAQIDGNTHTLEVMGNRPILEVLLDEQIDAPHSCTSGACASCMAKVEEGEVEMDVDFALTDEEKSAGYVLTCQARPKSPLVKVNYDI